jgi:hypothetical protein
MYGTGANDATVKETAPQWQLPCSLVGIEIVGGCLPDADMIQIREHLDPRLPGNAELFYPLRKCQKTCLLG